MASYAIGGVAAFWTIGRVAGAAGLAARTDTPLRMKVRLYLLAGLKISRSLKDDSDDVP